MQGVHIIWALPKSHRQLALFGLRTDGTAVIARPIANVGNYLIAMASEKAPCQLLEHVIHVAVDGEKKHFCRITIWHFVPKNKKTEELLHLSQQSLNALNILK